MVSVGLREARPGVSGSLPGLGPRWAPGDPCETLSRVIVQLPLPAYQLVRRKRTTGLDPVHESIFSFIENVSYCL